MTPLATISPALSLDPSLVIAVQFVATLLNPIDLASPRQTTALIFLEGGGCIHASEDEGQTVLAQLSDL